MKVIAAGTFKVHCLAIMDEVQSRRETVIITKRGKPVAKLTPVSSEKDEIYGFLKGKVFVLGDVVSPALTQKEWGDLARAACTARQIPRPAGKSAGHRDDVALCTKRN